MKSTLQQVTRSFIADKTAECFLADRLGRSFLHFSKGLAEIKMQINVIDLLVNKPIFRVHIQPNSCTWHGQNKAGVNRSSIMSHLTKNVENNVPEEKQLVLDGYLNSVKAAIGDRCKKKDDETIAADRKYDKKNLTKTITTTITICCTNPLRSYRLGFKIESSHIQQPWKPSVQAYDVSRPTICSAWTRCSANALLIF